MTNLQVSGMSCNNCARHVTEAIQGVPGVQSAAVRLEAERASVRWHPGTTENVPAVIDAIQKAGYGARKVPVETSTDGKTQKIQNWRINLWLGAVVTIALMAGEWVFHFTEPWFRWLAFFLAGVVQVFAGAQFYRGAWNQLKIGSSNMDTLVALGSTTAFGYSAWALLSGTGGHLYFMEAAAIITLISFGHWLEARVSARAAGALEQLLQLAPQTARRLTDNPAPRNFTDLRRRPVAEPEMEVAVNDLKVGDRVVLRPGDHVPVDGIVLEGDSALDESMLTGESLPRDKKNEDKLYAGTVNLNGRLVMRVTDIGESTALSHIIAAVQRAQSSRADIQRLGDRVSGVFVPVVIVIAIAAGLLWGLAPGFAGHLHNGLAPLLWSAMAPMDISAGFIVAAAVLIVACPCAMGLATPAAIMAAANAAARRGILIRDGVALEKAGKITAVIFDKTGTLTAGKPEVVATWEIQDSKPKAQGLATALARGSTHPISQAMAKLPAEKIELTEWQEIRGSGVEGRTKLEGGGWKMARFGSLNWLKQNGVDLATGEKFIAEWSGQGATVVGLAVDSTSVGFFAVRDTVKPGARGVVERLRRQQLKIFLLTGDGALTAAGIARETGIDQQNVLAEVRPEQKSAFVKKLQAEGERVAFVGDGINDAPALEQADLGVAVSRASDVARAAADIILLKSEIEAVPEALDLARATLRTIKQNLFWAFFYNALGIPLAALGFMSPILCAAAMGFSDLIVIGNALRLLRRR